MYKQAHQNIQCLIDNVFLLALQSFRCVMQRKNNPVWCAVAVIFCTSSMTLVNDYEIKIIRIREKLSIVFCIILSDKLLVKCKIHLMRKQFLQFVLVLGIIYFMDYFFQRLEILFNGLIYQYIAVGQIKNFFL